MFPIQSLVPIHDESFELHWAQNDRNGVLVVNDAEAIRGLLAAFLPGPQDT
jgi:hypothetical protein